MDTNVALAHGLIHGVRTLVIPTNAFFLQIIV